MAIFYLVRHGQPDYTPCDERGYIGHGKDLAPLSLEGIAQAEKASRDERLKDADMIISSPYTRALQTAGIIAKNTGIDLRVEMDLHEWMPDLSFQYATVEEVIAFNEEFNKCKGIYPPNHTMRWEDLAHLRKRVRSVADIYANHKKVIVVAHGMALRTITYIEKMAPAEIVECVYEIGQPDCEYSFA